MISVESVEPVESAARVESVELVESAERVNSRLQEQSLPTQARYG